MPEKRKRFFVSYSRTDRELVEPVVALLRTAPTDVFFDSDSIEPGENWSERLETALKRTSLFVIFWCEHSAASEWVQNEWGIAVERKKKVIPVLLDSTPLPDELSVFQWIDFRTFTHHLHRSKSAIQFQPKITYDPFDRERAERERAERANAERESQRRMEEERRAQDRSEQDRREHQRRREVHRTGGPRWDIGKPGNDIEIGLTTPPRRGIITISAMLVLLAISIFLKYEFIAATLIMSLVFYTLGWIARRYSGRLKSEIKRSDAILDSAPRRESETDSKEARIAIMADLLRDRLKQEET